jgi:hypothetical protein
VGIPSQLYQRLKKPEWPSVASHLDPRVDGDDDRAFLVRSYLMGLIYRITRWKRGKVYETLCAWAKVQPVA